MVIDGGSAVCVGWTHYAIENFWFQGWLARIDLDRLAAADCQVIFGFAARLVEP